MQRQALRHKTWTRPSGAQTSVLANVAENDSSTFSSLFSNQQLPGDGQSDPLQCYAKPSKYSLRLHGAAGQSGIFQDAVSAKQAAQQQSTPAAAVPVNSQLCKPATTAYTADSGAILPQKRSRQHGSGAVATTLLQSLASTALKKPAAQITAAEASSTVRVQSTSALAAGMSQPPAKKARQGGHPATAQFVAPTKLQGSKVSVPYPAPAVQPTPQKVPAAASAVPPSSVKQHNQQLQQQQQQPQQPQGVVLQQVHACGELMAQQQQRWCQQQQLQALQQQQQQQTKPLHNSASHHPVWQRLGVQTPAAIVQHQADKPISVAPMRSMPELKQHQQAYAVIQPQPSMQQQQGQQPQQQRQRQQQQSRQQHWHSKQQQQQLEQQQWNGQSCQQQQQEQEHQQPTQRWRQHQAQQQEPLQRLQQQPFPAAGGQPRQYYRRRNKLVRAATASASHAATQGSHVRQQRAQLVQAQQQHITSQLALKRSAAMTPTSKQAAEAQAAEALAVARFSPAGLLRRRRVGAANYKLVRVGGQLYYSTPQGLRSVAATRLLPKAPLAKSRSLLVKVHHRNNGTSSSSGSQGGKSAVGLRQATLECCGHSKATAAAAVKLVRQRHHAKHNKVWVRDTSSAFQRTAAAAAGTARTAAGSKTPASTALAANRCTTSCPAAGVMKRLASSTAVARSLAIARARGVAHRAAARRGLCLQYCRHGKCEAALANKCEKVHDPDKVVVCQAWLLGRCTDDKCRLQHKVVPALMPVCTYFLEGVCSNRSCPYLHVKVAADAPVCRAFLQGYCPAGAACLNKHLTPKMVKQQQQWQQQWPPGIRNSAAAGKGSTPTSESSAQAQKRAAGIVVLGQRLQQQTAAEVVHGAAVADDVTNGMGTCQRSSTASLHFMLTSLLPDAET